MEENKDKSSLKKEILELKTRLNDTNQKKELFYNKKEELKKKTNSLITEIKSLKENTASSKENKSNRDELNKKVKLLVEEAKKLNSEKRDFMQKHNIVKDPSMIKSIIESMQFKIETEALSIEKEKSMMKKIRELRKEYSASSELKKIIDKLSLVSKEIDETRLKADSFHKKLTQGSIEHSEKFRVLSIEIEKTKAEEEEAFKKFLDYKKEFLSINNSLKEKLKESSKLAEKTEETRERKKETRKEKNQELLKEKAKSVEEKIKTKKKLTTEDLLAFQSSE